MATARLTIPSLFLSLGSWAEPSIPDFNQQVQAPVLEPSKRGSLAGELASFSQSGSDLMKGGITLALPISFPEERGRFLYPVVPKYAITHGISEWGMGFDTALSITRSRRQGTVQYTDDELVSPWGRLLKGTDGYFYPEGLQAAVRLEHTKDDRWLAYLENGDRLTFGGERARIVTQKGTYSWYLVEGESVTHEKSSYSYAAPTIAGERPLLEKVYYGGRGGLFQYQIQFHSRPLKKEIFDYRSTERSTLRRRIDTISVAVKLDGAFVERYAYHLRYRESKYGPGFFLVEVIKGFPSGVEDPPFRLSYNWPEEVLRKNRWVPYDAFSPILKQFPNALVPERHSILDLDENGQSQIEFANSYDRILLKDGSVQLIPIPGSSDDPDVDRYCRPPLDMYPPAPRIHSRLNGKGSVSEVLGFQKRELRNSPFVETILHICDLEGHLKTTIAIPGYDLRLGAWTKLVDLAQNGKPHLVWVSPGKTEIRLKVFENASTGENYAFLQIPKEIKLVGSLDKARSYSLFQDLNGDGILDFVLVSSTGLSIWYGRGDLAFERESQFVPFKLGSSNAVDLYKARINFHDLNGDGMPEAIVQTDFSAAIYINQGNQFILQEDSPLRGRNWAKHATQPLVVDLLGTGNVQIVAQNLALGQVNVIEISEPGTDLLQRVEDGKGNEIEFTYKRTEASRGIQYRFAVMDQSRVSVSGAGTRTESYAFGGPVLHSGDKSFLGFKEIHKIGDVAESHFLFRYGDQQPGVLIYSRELDRRVPSLWRFLRHEFENATSFGLSWLRRSSQEEGFTLSELWTGSASKKVEYIYQDRINCPSHISTRDIHGTAYYEIGYFDSEPLALSMQCIMKEFWARGFHQRPEWNFTEALRIQRNELGQALEIARLGAWPKVLQRLDYTSDHQIQSILVPGSGQTIFEYDSETTLLRAILPPDGVTRAVLRAPLHDQVIALSENRGGGHIYSQQFDFDPWQRLNKSWETITSSSARHSETELFYSYATPTAPAWIEAITKVGDESSPSIRREAVLFSGGGDELGTLLSTGSSGVLSQLKSIDLTQNLNQQHSAHGVNYRAFLNKPDYGALYSDTIPLKEDLSTALKFELQSSQLHQADVLGYNDFSYDVQSEQLIQERRENDSIAWMRGNDHQGKQTFLGMPDGKIYRYSYDALGRITEILLPSGETHQVKYNSFGEISEIRRAGLGSIVLTYQRESQLLEKKAYFDEEGVLIRSVSWLYDEIGRKTKLTYRDEQSGKEEAHSYFYDGKGHGSAAIPGQKGRLSAVVGPAYEKTWRYRSDGKVVEQKMKLKDFATLIIRSDYHIDGSLKSKRYERLNAAGKSLSKVALSYDLDAIGRDWRAKLDGDLLYELNYDGLSRVDSVSGPFFGLKLNYDHQTQAETGFMQAHNGNQSSYGTSWNKNNRGLIANEHFGTATDSLTQLYTYNDSAFLSSAYNEKGTIRYSYDDSQMLDQVERTEKPLIIQSQGGRWTTNTGTYSLDSLGRVKERKMFSETTHFDYGPQGRVSGLTQSPHTHLSYFYDDEGKRILKSRQGKVEEAYIDDVVLTPDALLVPIVVSGKMLAYLENGRVKTFSPDLRNTVVSDNGSDLNVPEPYGERTRRDGTSLRARLIDYALIGYDTDLKAYRAGHRDYDPVIKRFMTPDLLFLENPEKCVESPVECNLYGYAENNPVSYIDALGDMAGDVWLYKSDNSDISKFVHFLQGINSEYTHASIEIKNTDHYTAHTDYGDGRGGSSVIDQQKDILFNQNGYKPREIDIYRHVNSALADINKLDSMARTATGENGGGKFGLSPFGGVCSEAAARGTQAAGLNLDPSRVLYTPQGLAGDSHLKHVGTYNTAEQRSELPRK